MKYLWRGLLVGAAVYVVFFIATAPAAKLLPLLQPALQNVRLAGIEGSLWSGKAALVAATPVQLEQVRWRFRPGALFIGRIEYAVEGRLRGQALEARAGSSFLGQRYLADLRGQVSARDMLYWLGLKPLELDGSLDFDIDNVEWPDSGIPAVGGAVTWSPARVVAPIELVLGRAQLQTRIEGGMTRGKLEASGGALLVQADVGLDAGGAYRFNADIQQKGELPQAVSKFLSTFADYNNGTYRLEWSDSL